MTVVAGNSANAAAVADVNVKRVSAYNPTLLRLFAFKEIKDNSKKVL